VNRIDNVAPFEVTLSSMSPASSCSAGWAFSSRRLGRWREYLGCIGRASAAATTLRCSPLGDDSIPMVPQWGVNAAPYASAELRAHATATAVAVSASCRWLFVAGLRPSVEHSRGRLCHKMIHRVRQFQRYTLEKVMTW